MNTLIKYVIIVPMIAILYKKKSQAGTWVGAILATVGLYLLSVTATFEMVFSQSRIKRLGSIS